MQSTADGVVQLLASVPARKWLVKSGESKMECRVFVRSHCSGLSHVAPFDCTVVFFAASVLHASVIGNRFCCVSRFVVVATYSFDPF